MMKAVGIVVRGYFAVETEEKAAENAGCWTRGLVD